MHATPPRRRFGFTRVDLATAMLVLVFTGSVLLAQVQKVRDAANRTVSQNNLHQLALGSINCADDQNNKMPSGQKNFFPGPGVAPNNGFGPCLFHLLPYVEQLPLYKSSAGGNGLLMASVVSRSGIKTFLAPHDPTSKPGSNHSSYLANNLAFPWHHARFPASFADGVSNTIFFAEGYGTAFEKLPGADGKNSWMIERRWAEDPTWTPQPRAIYAQFTPRVDQADATIPQGFSPKVLCVGLGDGSVRTIATDMTARTFYAACTPAGDEVLGNDW